MPTAIDEFPRTDYHFYTMGLQYYAAGRFGALHRLSPVTGNLLHHAVEMIHKGRLAQEDPSVLSDKYISSLVGSTWRPYLDGKEVSHGRRTEGEADRIDQPRA